MKKHLLIILITCAIQVGFAQKIYFSKSNYENYEVFEKNISNLAQQVIKEYHDENKAVYYNNLFRLYVVAKNFALVKPTLQKQSLILYGDTTPGKALGFAYTTYIAALGESKSDKDFRAAYQVQFTNAYNLLNSNEKNIAAGYFENDIADYKSTLDAKIKICSISDSLSIADAVLLCRNYCTYKTYSSTQPLALILLKKIEGETYIRNDSVLIKMPDGATVSLTIIRDRKNTNPQPVVLMYNIYAGGDALMCKDAVSNGYIGIVANTRGKRLSKDSIEPFEHDAKDAYQIIDWISKQPWCNGKVGMYGGSYLGFSQWSAAKYMHPALKTIVPQVSVGAGIDYPCSNGVFMSFMLRWIQYVVNNKLTDDTEFGDTQKWNEVYSNWYKKGTSFRSLDTLEGRPNHIFQRWLQHPSYDSYWQNMTPQKEEFAKINIPILTTTGYWDDDQMGAMYYYNQYHLWNKNLNYYLIIGPYDHYGSQGYPSKVLTNYEIDSTANISIQKIVFQWFDYVMKDSARPAILKDKVNFEVMGKNKWMHVPSLDKMHNDTLTFYLGNALSEKRYSLLATKPSKVDYISQKVDLTDRSEIRFSGDDIAYFPAIIDSVLNPEKQKMVFVSDPIDKPFAISGGLNASLFVSTNKKDMDIIIDMYEQTPDGKYFALNQNIQRASFAKDRTKRQLLQPNKIETINIKNTFITCKQLQKGSRIVVVVGVNKSPLWQLNYGTGKDVSDETIKDAAIPMQIKWFNNSCVKLSVLR